MNTDSYTDYRNAIDLIAAEVIERSSTDERFEPHDYVHQLVDGAYWVIYTHAAKLTLEYSDHRCRLFDEYGMVETDNWSDLYSRGAYCAMEADVFDALEAKGFDINDPDSWGDDDDDDE